MKVTFIYHSGFLVELSHTYLLFDYYEGEIPALDPEKKLYVFVSHQHPDHFQMSIFTKFKSHPSVKFILSDDIGRRPEMWKTVFMEAGEEKIFDRNSDNPISVSTFRSTDEGVAFLVNCEGRKIYHAGDLNWWHWEGESKTYNRMMQTNYEKEIDRLCKKASGKLDLAFVVLDERQEAAYCLGMEYFLAKIACPHVFPMHFFADGYGVVQRFLQSDIEGKEAVAVIDGPGMEFDL